MKKGKKRSNRSAVATANNSAPKQNVNSPAGPQDESILFPLNQRNGTSPVH